MKWKSNSHGKRQWEAPFEEDMRRCSPEAKGTGKKIIMELQVLVNVQDKQYRKEVTSRA